MSGALGPSGAVSRWRHLRAIVSLPLTTAVLIPAVILVATDGFRAASLLSIAPSGAARLAVGGGLLATGAALVAGAISLLVRFGQGTLAPWDPPRQLVVAGLYRHSRNPMKLGLFAVLLGEALVLGSWPLLVWFACFAAANVVYVPLFEEPALRTRFGLPYAEYGRHVPRWIPRRTAWVTHEHGEDREQ